MRSLRHLDKPAAQSRCLADTCQVLRRAWWILGLVLVGAVAAVALSSQAGTSEFGWFAYAPVGGGSDGLVSGGGSVWSGTALILTRWQVVGCAVVAFGLIALTAGLGFHLGRRRTRSREQL